MIDEVVVVRRLSRRWKVNTLLGDLSPASPAKAEITNQITPKVPTEGRIS
jgi:hypothetical protein